MATLRKRPLVHLSLSPEAIARLKEIATRCGESSSGMVERLIRDAEMPRPKTVLRRENSGDGRAILVTPAPSLQR